MDLLKFRRDNNLTQSELGDYLGIKNSFISKIEKGGAKMPKKYLQMLLGNDKGWIIDSLTQEMEGHIINNHYQSAEGDGSFVNISNSDYAEIRILQEKINGLREYIAQKDRDIELLRSVIEMLTNGGKN